MGLRLRARHEQGAVHLAVLTVLACVVLGGSAAAQDAPPGCRFLCAPEFKVEPTFTITNLFGGPRLADADGNLVREPREHEFELILSLDLPTMLAWFGFTVEAMFLPFDGESTPELEFETNFTWLDEERTGGWVSSHFDVVDKFSPAERPSDRSAYTHKLNFEWDTAVALFSRLPRGRWLRDVELEGSLDYVATGLPKAGDLIDGETFVTPASPWSFSLVLVIPLTR